MHVSFETEKVLCLVKLIVPILSLILKTKRQGMEMKE